MTRLYEHSQYWRVDAGNFSTMPQYFKDFGYQTFNFGKIFHPGAAANGSADFPYSWSEFPYFPPNEKYKDAKLCQNAHDSNDKTLYDLVLSKFITNKNLKK